MVRRRPGLGSYSLSVSIGSLDVYITNSTVHTRVRLAYAMLCCLLSTPKSPQQLAAPSMLSDLFCAFLPLTQWKAAFICQP